MAYADLLRKLGDSTATAVVAIFEAWQSGEITEAEAVDLIATAVAGANSTATALGDASLAATLTLALRQAVPALGLLPPKDDVPRLRRAATTLLGIVDVSTDRMARLGRSEPLTRAADAYSEGMKKSPHVTGWVRGLSANACQLCEWWSRGGKTWPDDHPMPTHKGCTCTPEPVVIERNFRA